MTLALVSPVTFTDSTLPLFPLEVVPGTILLLEPSRSPTFAGVPATGAAVPDLAGNLAGAGGILQYTNMTGTTGKVERTTKGGIHAIKTASSVFAYAGITINQATLQYILNNIGHKFFFSVWGRYTRAGLSPSDAHFAFSFSNTPGTSQLLVAAMPDATVYPGATLQGTKKFPAGSVVSPASPTEIYSAASVQGYTGSVDKTAAQAEAGRMCDMFGVGSFGPFNPGNGNAASKVFYRAFIEDITVSGRSFAQLSAIDYGFFVTHVQTTGGRYFGDTFTDPATIP